MPTIAFDIDETILHTPEGQEKGHTREHYERKIPCGAIVPYLLGLQTEFRMLAITGRDREIQLFTYNQLSKIGFRGFYLTCMPHDNGRFLGFYAMAQFKADKLQYFDRRDPIKYFIGDHWADELAAQMAGIPFLYAHKLKGVLEEFQRWRVENDIIS